VLVPGAAAGCDTPARDCHQHHITPRNQHGHSSTENLGDHCKHHHLYTSHAGGWTIRKCGDGTWEATAPDGRTLKTPGRRETESASLPLPASLITLNPDDVFQL
jgi:hypothetical protein